MAFKKATPVNTTTNTTTIAATSEMSIAKMQLEVINKGNELVGNAKEAVEAIQKVVEFAEQAKANLGMQVKVKEIETNEAIEALETKLHNKEVEISDAIVALDNKLKEAAKENERKIEELNYKNSLAIRDSNKAAADTIAKGFAMELVLKTELDRMKTNELTPEKLEEIKETTKKETTDSLNKSFAFKEIQIKTDFNTQIKLLEKELEMTKASLVEAKAENVEFKGMIQKHGLDIQNALNAARANINVGSGSEVRK